MTDLTLLQDTEFAAGIFVGVGIAFLYLIYWLRRRRKLLGTERLPTRAELQDRAYNQISIARSASDHLDRSGVDVSSPRKLIESAEAARRRGDPDTALGLAKSAQATLLALRQNGPTAGPAAAEAAALGVMPSAATALPSASAAEGAPTPVAPRLPPNKAESRFQLSLLRDELAAAARAPSPTADLPEAQRLAREGEVAFARGDYTESLRLGLRGRRAIGGRVEALAPSRATRVEATGGAAPPRGDGESGAATHCGTCGQPLRENGRFCRGCGASQGAPRCGSCGEALASDDRFCGACGAPIRA